MNAMKGLRRALVLSVIPLAVAAQDYPSKPVTLVVGFAAGSGTDLAARQLADRLAKNLKQSVIVENRPGAGGTLATSSVVRATPDGYTLLIASNGPLVVAPMLMRSVKFDVQRELVPVAFVARSGLILSVNSNSRFKTATDLAAAIKAEPGRVSFANSGVGTSNHLLSEMLAKQLNGSVLNVPYKGPVAGLSDVAGGAVDAMFDIWPLMEPFFKSGKLKPLAVASDKRHPHLPNVPTLVEAGLPRVVAESWTIVMAPVGTPAQILTKLSQEIAAIQTSDSWQKHMLEVGAQSAPMTETELRAFLKSEVENWQSIVTTTKIQLD